MTDQISYTIGDRLYLNITDRCTLECRFCPKTLGRPEVQGYDLTLGHRPTCPRDRRQHRRPGTLR